MTDRLITGKKGNGKTIFAVGAIIDAIKAGKRVATNLDINIDQFSPDNRMTFIRLPDCPTVEDFELLGRGQEGVVEEDNGLISLDEVSKIFNARSWGDKARQPVLDWLVHSRKYGWDVDMIAQGQEQLDKQLRTSLLEYWVSVKRTDKWPIPFITPLSRFIRDFPLLDRIIPKGGVRFPKYHIGTIRHGFDINSLITERKWYKGKDYYHLYNTQQIFLDRDHPDACAIHTVLSAWHIKGRYLTPKKNLLRKLRDWINGEHLPKPLPPKDKHPLVDLLQKLPEAERLKHWRRLNDLGAFDIPSAA